MLNQQEKNQIRADLSKYDNIGDMFTYLNSKYDLSRAKLGFLTKPKYIDGVITSIEILNPPKK